MSLWSRLTGKSTGRSGAGAGAAAGESRSTGDPAPVVTDPYSRGFDKEFRLSDDAEYVVRINQRPPTGLPRKLAEFVAVAGIAQPEAIENVRGFISGLDRKVELTRIRNHVVDPNAIAVIGYWSENGAVRTGQLGYLPADVAASIAQEGPEAPVGATLEVMYAPTPGRNPGLRLDIWTSRRKVARAVEQPYAAGVRVPSDPVARNLFGKELETKGLVDDAIECYEANVRDGFDGNYPYDRLAIIFRRRMDGPREVVVLSVRSRCSSDCKSRHAATLRQNWRRSEPACVKQRPVLPLRSSRLTGRWSRRRRCCRVRAAAHRQDVGRTAARDPMQVPGRGHELRRADDRR